MKVEVTATQCIETDDIVFAEQGLSDNTTLVYLRSLKGGSVVVHTDYDDFVATINQRGRLWGDGHIIKT